MEEICSDNFLVRTLAKILWKGVFMKIQKKFVVAERGHGDTNLGEIVQILKTEEEKSRQDERNI